MTVPPRNPYKILGVPKNASVAQIRSAYRTKSKQAHPDAGGNPLIFQALKAAHDLLLDPKRRAHYDQTGETLVADADNSHADFMLYMAGLFENALADLEKQNASDTGDLVATMRRVNRERLQKGLDAVGMLEENLKHCQKLVNRLCKKVPGAKAEDDPMASIVNGRLSMIQDKLRGQKDGYERHKALHDRADALLSQYTDTVALAQAMRQQEAFHSKLGSAYAAAFNTTWGGTGS